MDKAIGCRSILADAAGFLANAVSALASDEISSAGIWMNPALQVLVTTNDSLGAPVGNFASVVNGIVPVRLDKRDGKRYGWIRVAG